MSLWTYCWNIGKKVKIACYTWHIEGSNPLKLVNIGVLGEHNKKLELPIKTHVSLEMDLKYMCWNQKIKNRLS